MDMLIHLVRKKLVADKCKNIRKKYFAKDIPKDNEALKRWSHINPQITYVNQHKHVDFIPHNIIDYHQFIIKGGVRFF